MSDEKNLGVSQKLVSPSRSTSSCSSKQGSRQDSWEVVEGLRGEMTCTQEPPVQKGFLLKKRKWPLKGWHKRFFYLDKGILKYAKSQTDIEREKLHGCIDVGLSVMSVKKSSKCIDLDTEEHIYHLKVSPSQGWLLPSSCHQGFCWLLSCPRQSLTILPVLDLDSWAPTVPSFHFPSSQGSGTAFPARLCRGLSTAIGLFTTMLLVTWGQLLTIWVVFVTEVSLRDTIDVRMGQLFS
ncbi:Oxysterol-binding protein-related protein 3 [Lemmus lemmus]